MLLRARIGQAHDRAPRPIQLEKWQQRIKQKGKIMKTYKAPWGKMLNQRLGFYRA
jgi:hypothetical protein